MVYLRKYWGLFIIILLSIFSIIPFFHSGFYTMHDDTQVARVYEMGKALFDGQFPVRLVQDLGYGYGYPIYNFYSPLAYYFGGLLILLGFNALLATKVIFVFGIVLAGISMYLLVRSFTGNKEAVVAGILYLYFPYHAVDIYVRGDLAELFAYGFLPLVFLGIYKLFYTTQNTPNLKQNLKWILFSSISIALVIISHNLTAYMLFIFIMFFIIFSVFHSRNKIKLLFIYFLAFFLGFLLSSFYWLPAIYEMKYTNIYSQVGGGANYTDHFVCPFQLWDSPWGYGGSVKGCIDGLSFRLGKTNIIFLIVSLVLCLYIALKKKFQENRFIYFSSIVFLLFSILLLLDLSTFIWNIMPFMPFLQYPWRFLSFAGLFLSIIIGLSISKAGNLLDKKMIGINIFIIILFTLFTNLKLFQSQFYTQNNIDSYKNKQYLNWTVSKISDEYMPVDFSKPKSYNQVTHNPIEITNGKGKINNIFVKTGLVLADVDLKMDSSVKFNIAYFPAWKIFVNGRAFDYKIGKVGLYINLIKGKYKVEARFMETPLEKLANILSIIGILITVIVIIRFRSYGKKAS